MLYSELYKIVVNEVTLVDLKRAIIPITPWICP